jgi:cytochrome P450
MSGYPLFPLPDRPGVSVDPDYLRLFRSAPLIPVTLRNGRTARLVTRHQDVRTVLSDDRFSRGRWDSGTLFARDSTALALASSDPPVHSRRKKAVQGWFTHRKAEQARTQVEAVAEKLLDDMEADGPPVDLIKSFTTPLPYLVICDMLGIPAEDLPELLPQVTVMMSAGRFPADLVRTAHERMYEYFFELLAARRRQPDVGLITALLRDGQLSDSEIAVFGFGLLMAGGETTVNHLGMCVQQVLRDPDLADALRHRPDRVPAAVEELLRWIWFGGTGGHPHVTTEEVELAGTLLAPGEAVIPLSDTANRDPAAFEYADEFRPDRDPNPHLGLGYGRHACMGAALARVELQVGLSGLLRRFSALRLAIPQDRLDWRTQMFIRGTWSLPVTWSA